MLEKFHYVPDNSHHHRQGALQAHYCNLYYSSVDYRRIFDSALQPNKQIINYKRDVKANYVN